jgi:hypothetical protein
MAHFLFMSHSDVSPDSLPANNDLEIQALSILWSHQLEVLLLREDGDDVWLST